MSDHTCIAQIAWLPGSTLCGKTAPSKDRFGNWVCEYHNTDAQVANFASLLEPQLTKIARLNAALAAAVEMRKHTEEFLYLVGDFGKQASLLRERIAAFGALYAATKGEG